MDLDFLSKNAQEEARRMLANLPAGLDVGTLYFTRSAKDGLLYAWAPATNTNLVCRQGITWQFQYNADGTTEMTAFLNGKIVQSLDVNLEEGRSKKASGLN